MNTGLSPITEDLWNTYAHTVMDIGPDYTSTQRALESHMRADMIHPALEDQNPKNNNHDSRDDAAPEGAARASSSPPGRD